MPSVGDLSGWFLVFCQGRSEGTSGRGESKKGFLMRAVKKRAVNVPVGGRESGITLRLWPTKGRLDAVDGQLLDQRTVQEPHCGVYQEGGPRIYGPGVTFEVPLVTPLRVMRGDAIVARIRLSSDGCRVRTERLSLPKLAS